MATTRLVYKAILETFGTDYAAFRVLGTLAVLLSAGLFFSLVKRRIGAVPALAPTLVLLFFGSAWGHVVVPIGFTDIFSIAAGLAALLALERGDPRGDVAACALLALSVATFSIGIAFAVGIAISVLIRPDRRRRAWIFLIPLVLYAGWWLYALPTESPAEPQAKASNVLVLPSYVAESLAAVTGALVGLDYDFANPAEGLELGWGRIVATLAVVALVLRIRRGSVPASLWVSLGILLTYWGLASLVVDPLTRPPGANRYIYTGAVGVLLVATAAAGGIRFSRLGLAALFAAAAISLATNLALLRDGAARFRNDYSSPARAQFAMLELARGHVDPGFDPAGAVPPDVSPVSSPAATYFAVVDRYGSPAYSLSELERQADGVRQDGDRILASALGLHLEASASGGPAKRCRDYRSTGAGEAIVFELPAGGASLHVRAAGPSPVAVGRFADTTSVELGSVSPGETATLAIPSDSAPNPWRASVGGARSVKVCGP